MATQAVFASQLAFGILADGSSAVRRMLIQIMNGTHKLPLGTQAESLAVVQQRRDDATHAGVLRTRLCNPGRGALPRDHAQPAVFV